MKDEIVKGLLTERMDIGNQEFKDFQLLVRSKAESMLPEVKNRVAKYTIKLREHRISKNKQLLIETYYHVKG